MIKRLETVLCLSAAPLGASGNTTGRMARLRKPYVRRRAKPFNSHPVSKSCAIQAYRLWMEYPSRFLDELSSHKLTTDLYPYQNITGKKVTVDNIEGTREAGTAMGQDDEKFAMPGLPDGTK